MSSGARVLVDNLCVREGPSVKTGVVAKYNKGEIIKTVNSKIVDRKTGETWLVYTGSSGKERYVCAERNGERFIDY